MKKLLVISLIFLITLLSLSGCGYTEADLEESYDAGSHAGYEAGYDIGYEQGFADGEADYWAGYDEGYNKGHSDGESFGYDRGYQIGFWAGEDEASGAYSTIAQDNYDQGYFEGYAQGRADALAEIPSTRFVGSINSDVYHYPWCIWAKKILPENEVWFDSVEEAQAAGYRPCKVCNPPSHLVLSLGGSGDKTSETFYITSEDWHIDWNYQGTGIGVTIYLYPQNAIHFKDLWIDSFGSNTPGANRVYFHNQTGGFYLYILAVGEWQIEVYE